MNDTFRGDNAHMVRSIEALLNLDAAGAMAPHGIGGHARELLESAAVRLLAPEAQAADMCRMHGESLQRVGTALDLPAGADVYTACVAAIEALKARAAAQAGALLTVDVVEQIAQKWDGCEYEGVGGDIDIGDSIRRTGLNLALAATQPNAAAEVVAWRYPLGGGRYAATTNERDARSASTDGSVDALGVIHAAPGAAIDAREQSQRERMSVRFAHRPKSGATADFDLPAESDAVEAPEQETVQVPLTFIRGFYTLAHNYSLTAVPPDYYWGNERDAFSSAYRRCGQDLVKLRALIPAKPRASRVETPAVRLVAEPDTVLRGVDELVREAYEHWDADREFKVGKILLALLGHNKGYDKRADAWRAAIGGL
ncbi:hypothetical protein J2W28_001058 [Variovorax boronicumulans]|uniref:hypothetical protein n=1 Tax=Variovorax boronicumulans TaxID=436515 RepID=UPI00278A15C3|nr:hypothetical protein [Variovorax boronicumulans]MDP9992030.1 hypothetical protein [Variovorax boronicumulans]MDQ0001925.1 hypothetical protein [Variovorax boronicumulans]